MEIRLLFVISIALINLHTNAQITFQKTFGGTGDDKCYFVKQTNDDGFILGGQTKILATGADYDVYLVKTSSDGTLLWTKTYGRTGVDVGESVSQTNDGGFIISGYTKTLSSGADYDVYLLKTTSNGSLQWSYSYGGTGDDRGLSVQQTNDGGFIIGGNTNSFGAGGSDMYLVKTDSGGLFQWTKTFGGTNQEFGYSVDKTNDGGFIIGGQTSSFGAGGSDMYLVKTDSDGTMQWTKTFGGSASDQGFSFHQTNDGGFIIGGQTLSFGAGASDAYLVKTSSDGSLQWAKTFGGTSADPGFSIQQTIDEGFIITGQTSSFGAGTTDMYLLKTDSVGSLQWSKAMGGTGADQGYYVEQTNDGGFIVGGQTKSFGPGNNVVFLLKTDSNGNSGCNETNTNTQANSGGVQATGGVQGTGGMANIPPTQTGSGGVATSLCTTVGINGNNHTESFINIYPNPFSTQTILYSDNILKNATLIVYNCFGQAVREIKNVNGQSVTLQRDNLQSGLYFIRLTQENKIFATEKIIITDN